MTVEILCSYDTREGPSVDNRWKWNETVGPLVSRPGHQGKLTSPSSLLPFDH